MLDDAADDSLVSPNARRLQPYQPGEQATAEGTVKLNTNENPYPPSPNVISCISAEAVRGLERYPDPESKALCAVLAAHYGVGIENVFVGNGSDEVLAHAFSAFFRHEHARLLIPDVTYSFYAVYCQLFSILPQLVPVDSFLNVDLAAFRAHASDSLRIAGVVIANPNAPTGESLPLDSIRRLLSIEPSRVVLVDEAYVDFGGESSVELVREYRNLLVVQTLSKSRSLAGLRVGFAIGHPDLIDALKRIKNSFNSYPLGRLAQAGAIAAIEDNAHFNRTRDAIIATRSALAGELSALGFCVHSSQANFLFVRHPNFDAENLARRLKEAGILVRHFRQPRIEQHLRISVGTEDQSKLLVGAIRRILSAAK